MPDARTDVELVRRGLARSRRHAADLVAAGRVSVGGRTVSKPSAQVDAAVVLDVAADATDPGYASRAGVKLAGALDALEGLTDAPIPGTVADTSLTGALAGARCLDLGASTGGFTDVLLRRGAAHVVALDVGHGQIVPRLRDDPRVTVVEGCNVRDLTPGTLAGPDDVHTDRTDRTDLPDVVVGDLSFISLSLVLGPVAGVLGPAAHALLLIKPQFEVGRERLGAGGVVRDAALHVEAMASVVRAGAEHGLRALAFVPSPLPGPSGNREYFCWLRPAATPPEGAGDLGPPVLPDVEAVVSAARAAAAWAADLTPAGSAGPAPSSVPPVVPPVLPIGGTP